MSYWLILSFRQKACTDNQLLHARRGGKRLLLWDVKHINLACFWSWKWGVKDWIHPWCRQLLSYQVSVCVWQKDWIDMNSDLNQYMYCRRIQQRWGKEVCKCYHSWIMNSYAPTKDPRNDFCNSTDIIRIGKIEKMGV